MVQAVEGPVFHNRLTHSLKVAQLARRLAEYVVGTSKETGELEAVGWIDPDVAETAALAHDLGHPPFGHIAEEALDRCLSRAGVTDGYEGNAQSFRIVNHVAVRRGIHRGLDLTFATLNAILKYPWPRGHGGKQQHKWGYYFAEKEVFQAARGVLPPDPAGLLSPRRSAEAEIMDWADDVTYAVHDLDDFYRAGLIPLDRLLIESPQEIEAFVYRANSNAKARQSEHRVDAAAAATVFRGLRGFAGPTLERPYRGERSQREDLDRLSSVLIKRYVVGVNGQPALKLNPEMNADPRVQVDPELRAEVDLLKELMGVYVYNAPALVAQQQGQRRVITALFKLMLEAVNRGVEEKDDGSIVPELFRADFELIRKEPGREHARLRARLTADILASLTENQALLLYQRLTGVAPGSFRNVIVY